MVKYTIIFGSSINWYTKYYKHLVILLELTSKWDSMSNLLNQFVKLNFSYFNWKIKYQISVDSLIFKRVFLHNLQHLTFDIYKVDLTIYNCCWLKCFKSVVYWDFFQAISGLNLFWNLFWNFINDCKLSPTTKSLNDKNLNSYKIEQQQYNFINYEIMWLYVCCWQFHKMQQRTRGSKIMNVSKGMKNLKH